MLRSQSKSNKSHRGIFRLYWWFEADQIYFQFHCQVHTKDKKNSKVFKKGTKHKTMKKPLKLQSCKRLMENIIVYYVKKSARKAEKIRLWVSVLKGENWGINSNKTFNIVPINKMPSHAV